MAPILIKMPKPPRAAYNPARPANALLLSHVRELEKALIAMGRTVRRKAPRTEGQVAAYIQHLNRALYHQALLPNVERRPLDVPIDEMTPVSSRQRQRASATQPAASSRRKTLSVNKTVKKKAVKSASVKKAAAKNTTMKNTATKKSAARTRKQGRSL
ncbi:MAG: hypothetical protein LBQ09_02430 [Acidobacteriaceae bacterium]|nr:hypothetical protein [Acidobacteriaceae bacterium]